jgi:hypothetical protein
MICSAEYLFLAIYPPPSNQQAFDPKPNLVNGPVPGEGPASCPPRLNELTSGSPISRIQNASRSP